MSALNIYLAVTGFIIISSLMGAVMFNNIKEYLSAGVLGVIYTWFITLFVGWDNIYILIAVIIYAAIAPVLTYTRTLGKRSVYLTVLVMSMVIITVLHILAAVDLFTQSAGAIFISIIAIALSVECIGLLAIVIRLYNKGYLVKAINSINI